MIPGITASRRLSAGGDPFFNNVSLLAHFDGANGSTSFVDSSKNNLSLSTTGGAQITTTGPRFGTGCALFTPPGVITSPSNTLLDLGAEYTIEFQAKPNTLSGNAGLVHRGFYNASTNTWEGLAYSIRVLGSVVRFYFFGTSNFNERYIDVPIARVLSTSEWRHIAMVLKANLGYIFVKGQLEATTDVPNLPAPSSRPLKLGVWDFSAGAEYYNGRLDELRITKGVARYTANFTPPDAPFPNF